ncbi:MAG: hypothetical protein Ct9H300mP1_12380 [Planctomycetaceae bacterium]|nr:MAG: hypothetical protein Ct9H300mP1_12380 [Planctomycetaceae bacterium]
MDLLCGDAALLFGVSFQLPLVMLFLGRLSIFNADIYRNKDGWALLVISIVSKMLTPPDPASMVMMMFPLILLYELGICCAVSWHTATRLNLPPSDHSRITPVDSPFQPERTLR